MDDRSDIAAIGRDLARGSRLSVRPLWTLTVASIALASACAAPAIASAATPALTATPTVSSAPLYSSSPFVSSPSHHTWYRIPAIVMNSQGDLLAFAERRDNDGSDDRGDFDIVLRRSTDGGRTWGILRTIADDGANAILSPAPVVDPATGDVLLFTSIKDTKGVSKGLFLQRSTDGGTTFTPLSASRITVAGWKGGLTGPGHGIVLRSGEHAGRIVVALGYRTSTYYGGYGIYSDDGGRSWRAGYDGADRSGHIGYIEGTIAELPGGGLVISYRDKLATTPGETRYYAYSYDGGETLATGFAAQSEMKIHSVEGSLLNPAGTYGGLLLFSAPSYTSAADRTLRRDMAIFVSTDAGATWRTPYHLELESKPAAYSDLVQLDDGTVGVLYETGTVKWRERIVFRQIRLADLANPAKVASSVKAGLSARSVTAAHRATVRVTVAIKGVGSPIGKVRVTFTRTSGASGSVMITLTYSNRGTRYVTLPKLKRGTYRISVTYGGTSRIAAKTVSAGTLTVR
jgi:sialidase-1